MCKDSKKIVKSQSPKGLHGKVLLILKVFLFILRFGPQEL